MKQREINVQARGLVRQRVIGTVRAGAALLLFASTFVCAEERRQPAPYIPPPPPLVEAHLRQAQPVKPTEASKPADALRALTQEISGRLDDWEKRLAKETSEPALLAGIPAELLQKARAAATDDVQSRDLVTKTPDLPLLLALTAERNQEVLAARENWRAQLKHFDQAAYLEELVYQYRSFVGGLDTLVGPQRQKEMPEMTFPFPSALTLKGQIVDSEAQLARIGYEMVLRNSLNEMARAFFRIGFLRKAIGFVRENRELLAQLKESQEARLRTGIVEQSELLMALSDLAMMDARLTMLEREEEAVRGKANALLNLPVDLAWRELPATSMALPDGSLTALLTRARTDNQDLKMARQDVTLMELMVRMAETEVLPRGSLGYSQLAPPMKASTGSSMGTGTTASGSTMKPPANSSVGGDAMGSGLTIRASAGPSVGAITTGNDMAPRFPDRIEPDAGRAAFGANAAYLDETRIRVVQTRLKFAAMRVRTDQEVQEALTMYASAARDWQQLDEIVVPKAEETLVNQRQRYAAGTASLQVFLSSGRARLEVLLRHAESRSTINTRVVNLWNVLGQSAAAGLAPGR